MIPSRWLLLLTPDHRPEPWHRPPYCLLRCRPSGFHFSMEAELARMEQRSPEEVDHQPHCICWAPLESARPSVPASQCQPTPPQPADAATGNRVPCLTG